MGKICTTLEQSKKLIELGIDTHTADMFYWYGEKNVVRIGGRGKQSEYFDIPAWSLSALLKLMPESFIPDNGVHQVYRMEVYNHDGLYCCDYVGEIERDSFIAFAEEDYIDAAFEMICWLLENKKL